MTELQPLKFTDSVNNIEFRLQGDTAPQEIIRLDSEGFHYRGQLIEDAGEAHRLMVEFLKQSTQSQPEPVAELAAKLIAESKPMDLEMAAALTTEARWGLYEGSLTPHPEPVAPTDEELDELKDDYWWLDANHSKPWIPFARAVLARWGTPAIQPVPVSERLPGPEDCDAEGRCWWFVPEDDEQPSNWYLDGQPPAREIRFYGNTHWLPHYALPTPRSGTH